MRGVLAGLLAVALVSGRASAAPVDQGTAQVSPQARESPYSRYAREHAKSAEKKPSRVKPTPSVNRHSPRGSPQSGRR
jgi:hypothetical protein